MWGPVGFRAVEKAHSSGSLSPPTRTSLGLSSPYTEPSRNTSGLCLENTAVFKLTVQSRLLEDVTL